MKREDGNWTDYRKRFSLSSGDEIDLHFGKRPLGVEYWETMADVAEIVENSLRQAQAEGRPYLMFKHGSSTSRLGQTTARSVVGTFMRSPQAKQRFCRDRIFNDDRLRREFDPVAR
jgi:hypothetical protein